MFWMKQDTQKIQTMWIQVVQHTKNHVINIDYFFNFYDNNISVRNFVMGWKYDDSFAFMQSSDSKAEVNVFI